MAECPTCDEKFDSKHGMMIHHSLIHGESLAKKKCVCENCGTAFEEFQSRIKNGKGRFCSRKCKYDIGRVEVECAQCGTVVKQPQHRAKRYDQSFCSRQCNNKWLMVDGNAPGWNQQREDHSQWRGGTRTWYGTNWKEQREKALNRDGYQCVVCGMTREKHKERYNRDLTVHHRIPIREFWDGDDLDYESANDVKNLMTVCRGCHKRWDLLPVQPEVI